MADVNINVAAVMAADGAMSKQVQFQIMTSELTTSWIDKFVEYYFSSGRLLFKTTAKTGAGHLSSIINQF